MLAKFYIITGGDKHRPYVFVFGFVSFSSFLFIFYPFKKGRCPLFPFLHIYQIDHSQYSLGFILNQKN